MILDRYFARRFLWTFAGVFGVFVIILASIGFVEELRRLSNYGASLPEILKLSALSLPEAIYAILPLVMIISAIALFLGLARSSEMVVTRSAGRGALRAMVPPLLVSLVIGIFAVAVLNPIVATTSRQFEVQFDAIRGEGSVLSIAANGLWLRQGGPEGQTVIHADGTNLNGTRLSNTTFTNFSSSGRPIQRISSETAQLLDGEWQLTNAKIWPLSGDQVPEAAAMLHDTYSIQSSLTPDQIRDSFGTPSSIPIWDLPAFIDRLQTAGFSAQRHEVWFQMELAQPLFLVSMVLIGAAFTLRHQRGGRTGLMVMLAILLSFAIYFLRNFSQILGENGQIPPILAAWAPPLAAIALAMGLLLHNEDG